MTLSTAQEKHLLVKNNNNYNKIKKIGNFFMKYIQYKYNCTYGVTLYDKKFIFPKVKTR